MQGKFMTVVIQMPEDPAQRRRIADALGIGNEFHGGMVTAASLEDEITKVERYEERYGDLEDDSPALLEA